MKLLIRTDVSKDIGTGHLMRCMTLARKAHIRGFRSCFVLRDPEKTTVDFLNSYGIEVCILRTRETHQKSKEKKLAHDDWLAVPQEIDASDTLYFINDFKPDWIIVDHYALDVTWHRIVKESCSKVLVIDDLGDRQLDCDVLLDQNLGASKEKYKRIVSKNCKMLFGPHFALLRDEFIELREKSLKRRIDIDIEKVLINMGGVDTNNHTLGVLNELSKSNYINSCEFIVVIGESYPHTETLHEFLKSSEMNVSVLSNVTNMAEIMCSVDLCIGAAGSTSWERCCLGLPTITLAISDNQIDILDVLNAREITIASCIGKICSDFENLLGNYQNSELKRLSMNSSSVCDGNGALRVLDHLEHGND